MIEKQRFVVLKKNVSIENNPVIELLENILLNDLEQICLPEKEKRVYQQKTLLKIDSYRRLHDSYLKKLKFEIEKQKKQEQKFIDTEIINIEMNDSNQEQLETIIEPEKISFEIKKEDSFDLWPGQQISLKRFLKLFNTHTFLFDQKDFQRKARRTSYNQGFEKQSDFLYKIVENMNNDDY